jgi:zinc protease
LYFTEPRKDTEAFQSFISKQTDMIKKSKIEPEQVFYDTIGYAMGNYHPRRKPVTEDTYKAVNLDRAYDIYKERFANAGDFNFYFVGNVDANTLKPMVEKYIASLPSQKSKENFKDLNIEGLKGPIRKTVYKGKEPKSSVYLSVGGDFEFNAQNRHYINSLVSVLNIRLREELREEKGGVYGVGVYPQMTKIPKPKYSIIVNFGCDPERVEELVSTVKDVMKELQTTLPTDDNMLKTTETQKRSFESDIKENRFWMNNLVNYDMNGENANDMLKYNDLVTSLTKQDIQNTAKKYLDSKKMIEFVLMPDKK